jgi:hypothetical protein
MASVHRAVRAALAFVALLPWSAEAQVKVETVSCLGLPHCLRLSNGTVEVVVTTDVGPRMLRYAFAGGENVLGEVPEGKVVTELGEWRAIGGHRLWHAPEAKPRTYAPDNAPVRHETLAGGAVRLTQSVESGVGVEKQMTVTLDPSGTRVTIGHRLTNRNLWDVELAPWALTILAGGGTVVLPQEPYASHDDALLPARPLVLWHYTNLADPRFAMGPKYIRLRADASMPEPQKIGVGNKQGWAAYHRARTLFVKRTAYRDGAAYPDYGSNFETYTAGSFVEVESLGPLERLAPGASADHVERWHLFDGVDIGATDASTDAAMAPLVAVAR